MSGAKKGQLQAQMTADAVWQVEVSTDDIGGTAPLDVTTSGGTYYITELMAALESVLDAIDPAVGWTVTGSFGESGTGLVTIGCDDTNWSILWVDANLRDALGFAGASVAAASGSVAGTKQAKGLWMPTCPKLTKHGDGDAGDPMTDLLYTYAPTGEVMTIGGSASKTILPVSWSHVDRAKVRTAAETTGNASWQTFWSDCHLGGLAYCDVGAPVRLIWDADVPGTYGTYKIVDKPNADEVTVVDRWNGLYRVELNLIKVP
jgi:hypothetical protein